MTIATQKPSFKTPSYAIDIMKTLLKAGQQVAELIKIAKILATQ